VFQTILTTVHSNLLKKTTFFVTRSGFLATLAILFKARRTLLAKLMEAGMATSLHVKVFVNADRKKYGVMLSEFIDFMCTLQLLNLTSRVGKKSVLS